MSNEVKLNDGHIQILKKLSKINPTLKIAQGSNMIRSLSTNKTLFANAEFEVNFSRDVCIYDLQEFISALNIIKDPVLDLSNPKSILIRSDDRSQKLRYFDADENYITSYTEKEPKLPSEDITAVVTEDQIKTVMTAASTLRLEYIGFKGDGKNIYFRAFNSNDGDDQETNEFEIKLGDCEFTFNAMFKTDSVQFLDGNTTFVFCSPHKLVRIEGKDITYVTGLFHKSTFE